MTWYFTVSEFIWDAVEWLKYNIFRFFEWFIELLERERQLDILKKWPLFSCIYIDNCYWKRTLLLLKAHFSAYEVVAGVDNMTEGGLLLVILVHLGILVLLLHVMEDRDPTAVITTPLPHGGKTQGMLY